MVKPMRGKHAKIAPKKNVLAKPGSSVLAVALAANVPTECFKLVSALIVAVAIAMPQGRKLIALQRQKLARRKEGAPC